MAQNQIQFQHRLSTRKSVKIYDCVFIDDIENDSETIKFMSEIEWKLSSFNMLCWDEEISCSNRII
jgi:hypothetical protein